MPRRPRVARRQPMQTQPPQHAAEADLDPDEFEPVVGGAASTTSATRARR